MENQTVAKVNATHHSSPRDGPVESVLFNVNCDKLHMVQGVGEEDNRVGPVHVCTRHLGWNAALCPLICPVHLPVTQNKVRILKHTSPSLKILFM